jgi:hypothetical protein
VSWCLWLLCGVVEGDGRLGERETRTVELQGISASQCGSTVLGQHGKGCLDILGLDCNGSDTEGKMLHTDRRSHFWTVDKAGKYRAG